MTFFWYNEYMSEKSQLDFLAVGDLVIDAFIRLKDARITCAIDDENCEICMRWGDKIPYKSLDTVYAVGNSPNAAVSAARLGLSSGLMSHVGNDNDGNICIETLEKESVDTEFMTKEDNKTTNHHYVLSYEAERTILIKHEDFTYDLSAQTANKPIPKWLYFSSVRGFLAQYSLELSLQLFSRQSCQQPTVNCWLLLHQWIAIGRVAEVQI